MLSKWHYHPWGNQRVVKWHAFVKFTLNEKHSCSICHLLYPDDENKAIQKCHVQNKVYASLSLFAHGIYTIANEHFLSAIGFIGQILTIASTYCCRLFNETDEWNAYNFLDKATRLTIRRSELRTLEINTKKPPTKEHKHKRTETYHIIPNIYARCGLSSCINKSYDTFEVPMRSCHVKRRIAHLKRTLTRPVSAISNSSCLWPNLQLETVKGKQITIFGRARYCVFSFIYPFIRLFVVLWKG